MEPVAVYLLLKLIFFDFKLLKTFYIIPYHLVIYWMTLLFMCSYQQSRFTLKFDLLTF